MAFSSSIPNTDKPQENIRFLQPESALTNFSQENHTPAMIEEGLKRLSPSSAEISFPTTPSTQVYIIVQLSCTHCSKTLHYITRRPNGLWNQTERKNTMADPIHNAGYFAAVGTLLAILIIGALAIAGFRIPALRFPGFTNTGTLTIKVIDAPVDLAHLNITIDKLEILDSEGNWTNLELIDGEPIYFDLLALQNITLTLSRTEIPTGNYTKIRMHALTANATYTDGTTTPPLNLVANGKIDIILKPHLTMQAGGSIAITIDLEPETAQIAISHSLNLKPTMKAMVNE